MTNTPETLTDDSLQDDTEWKYFRFVSDYQEVLIEENNSWRIKHYEENKKTEVSIQNATDNSLKLDGSVPAGYLRLEQAVRRFVGLPEDSVIWNNHPGWRLKPVTNGK